MIKNNKIIKASLFELTKEQKESSVSLYGKVIKCLIAPYHTINTIPLEANNIVYVYPERDLTIKQRKELLSVMVNSEKEEILFVTSDLFIITDMVNDCVRILTPEGEIEECYEKTFGANPHSILFNILQNSVDDKTESTHRDIINKVISSINNNKTLSKEEYQKIEDIIDTIGEQIISTELKSMLREVKIV